MARVLYLGGNRNKYYRENEICKKLGIKHSIRPSIGPMEIEIKETRIFGYFERTTIRFDIDDMFDRQGYPNREYIQKRLISSLEEQPCPKCGFENRGWKIIFCTNCGSNLSNIWKEKIEKVLKCLRR